jgi:hypothetical protein
MMWQQAATAVAVITGLMLGWVAVQALKRRSDPRFRPGDDVLAGCGTCSIAEACRVAGGDAPDRCPQDHPQRTLEE